MPGFSALNFLNQSTKKPDITKSITIALPIAKRHLYLRCFDAARKKIVSIEFDTEKTARQLTLINPEKAF